MAKAVLSQREDAGSPIRPVTGKSTVELVADEIERAIMTGALPAGQEFSTAELSAKLNVSHIPVREALRRFEMQGLVRLRPGRRAVVSPIDPVEIEDAYRLWILICDDVVGRACERYTEEDLVELALQMGIFGAHDPGEEQAIEAHRTFHDRLLKPGASTWDLRLLNQLWMVMERGVRMTYATAALHEEPTYEAHRPLLEAARNRDAAALRQALRRHQEGHKELVIAAVRAAHEASASA